MSIIVALALGAVAFSAVTAIALGRVAGRADRDMELLIEKRLAGEPITASQTYAGLDPVHTPISGEPSIAVASASRSLASERSPVSSWTSPRPRVRLTTPGSGAKP